MICGNCSQETGPAAKFCPNCGAPLSAGAPVRELRKTVTILFSDITGSTGLGEQLDPEALRHVMSRYFDGMRSIIESHGGTVEKYIGDAIMAVFGIPVVHEDDAFRAVKAADEMQRALAALNDEFEAQQGLRLEVRTGIHTGDVVAGDPSAGHRLVTGDAVNTAARLEQIAAPGQILIGAETYRLVRDAVDAAPVEPLELRGKGTPVKAYAVTRVRPGATPTERRLDSVMVGRDHELASLRQAHERSVRERSCHLFTVLGAAGAGKSRLVREFLEGLEGRRVVQGRCLTYGRGITYFPVAEAIKDAARVAPDDSSTDVARKLDELLHREADAAAVRDHLLQIMGLSDAPATAEESAWAVRRLCETLADQAPLVVFFDDIHWAEPTFLDLVEYVVEWSRDVPVLLLCTARPELLDARPTWGGGKVNATTMLLDPLPETTCEAILGNLLAGATLPAALRDRILQSAEGNPLFIEEIVGMLIDDGRLQIVDGSCVVTGEVSDISVPATVQAVIAARLDRLADQERRVLEAASVIGRDFNLSDIGHLSPPDVAPELNAHLMGLVRKEMLRRRRSGGEGEGFAFRHVLIREAAYGSMPKQQRAELHEQFARWLGDTAGDRLAEHEEVLGYHCEQAYLLKRRLGLAGDAADVAAQAVRHLTTAAHRAMGRGDVSAAADLFARAAALEQDTTARAAIQLDQVEALMGVGDLSGADALLREIEATGVDPASAVAATAEVMRVLLGRMVDPATKSAEARFAAERAIARLEELGEHRLLARAYRSLADAAAVEGQATVAMEAGEKGWEHARLAGDVWEENENLSWVVLGLTIGSVPLAELARRLTVLKERHSKDRKLHALLKHVEGQTVAWQGDFSNGSDIMREARTMLLDLGLTVWYLGTAQSIGWVGLLSGHLDEAEDALREACTGLQKMGETSYLSTCAGLLGEVLLEKGENAEARQFAALCRDSAALDDVYSQVAWRLVDARLLAREGNLVAAEALAREALELGDQTDFFVMRGEPRRHLGIIYMEAGRSEEARRTLEESRAIYEQKGVVAWVNQIDRLLGQAAR